MAFTLSPLYGQGGSYTAQQDRLGIAGLAGTAGVAKITAPSGGAMTGDLAVVSSGTNNGIVNVAAGNVWVSGGSGQGYYHAYNDASIPVGGSGAGTTFVSTTATTTRYDVVYVDITDTGAPATNPIAAIKIVTGTPATVPSTPVVPSLPGGTKGLVLANVLLPVNFTAGASTVPAANITDVRKKALLYDASVATTASVATPSVGNIVYDASVAQVKAYNGTTWDGLLTSASLLGLNNTNMASGYRLTFQGTSAPPSPTDGMLWFDTTNQRLLIYRASDATWQRIANSNSTSATGCSIRQTTSTGGIGNGAVTQVSFQTEDYDSDGFITVPANTITIPAGLGGLYSITFSVAWDHSPSGTDIAVGAAIKASLSGVIWSTHAANVSLANLTVSRTSTVNVGGCSAVLRMAPADTLQFFTAQASGSTIPLVGSLVHLYRLSL